MPCGGTNDGFVTARAGDMGFTVVTRCSWCKLRAWHWEDGVGAVTFEGHLYWLLQAPLQL
jgi:hypothetical protein